MNALVRLLRLAFVVVAMLAVLLGAVRMALGDVADGAGGVASGSVLLYVLWWLPKKAVNGEDPTP